MNRVVARIDGREARGMILGERTTARITGLSGRTTIECAGSLNEE
jgi:hypothetical protein